MPLSKFVAYSAAGFLVWDTVLVYAGVVLGAHWQQAAGILNYLIAAAVAATGILVVAFLIKRKRRQTPVEPRE